MSRRDNEPLCSCCETHPDEREGGKAVKCPSCGELCTCEGCIADAENEQLMLEEWKRLDAAREASMEGGE